MPRCCASINCRQLAMPLLFHVLLVAVSLVASDGEPTAGDAYNASTCPKLLTCGDGVDIHYPFYRSDGNTTTDGADHSYCGYPGMAIACVRGYPVLSLSNGSYRVLNIDYGNNTVSLADTAALDGVRCPRVSHNVTIPPLLASLMKFPSSNTDYLTFFLNCTFTPDIAKPPGIEPISCRGFDGGAGLSYVLPPPDVPTAGRGGWPRACEEAYAAPVLRDSLWNVVHYSRFGDDGYVAVLRQGFQLVWDPSAGPCFQCEESKGRCTYNHAGGGGFMGCLCSDGLVRNSDCRDENLNKRRNVYIIASTSGILLLCLLFFAFLLGLNKYRSKKKSKKTPRIESFLQKNGNIHPKRYTYTQVKRMTRNFAEKLGQGGFGVVYRGDLSNGHQIAVKMLKDTKADGEEFINEIATISRTSHVNVVTLLGFCLEGSKRALIYEYMPNGSLERYTFHGNSNNGENTLGWEKLFDIAVGIARGLEYLHRGCNTRIVHFDIKPHNILLDQDFCPKISDFGLAKLCLNKESVISIGGARGTIGYIAPEVNSKQFGAVSSKSDVYSYGMMVLEMVGARDKNFNAYSESSSQYFPQWIYERLDAYCVSASEINGDITEIVRKMIVVGLWCIQVRATDRPTMTRVVEMLQGSTSGLELPPKALVNW